jgi:cytochrome c-type biogenesis protein CcsB
MRELFLIRGAAALYGAATLLSFMYLFAKEEKWSRWMLRLLTGGLILHLASFALRLQAFWAFPENRFYVPINSLFGALSFFALATALVFFLVEREHRLGILGAFVLPWTFIGAGAAAYCDPTVSVLAPDLRSAWLNVHPLLLMAAYAIFGNAFGVGLALLIQERQMKSRRPSSLCYRLPSLEELDALNTGLIAAALPVLVAGIFMGVLWAHEAWGGSWASDPKVVSAIATALIYGIYLHLAWFRGLRGRRAVYVSMLGFAAIVFTFVGVNFFRGLHDYL